jgi:hypothetical protein
VIALENLIGKMQPGEYDKKLKAFKEKHGLEKDDKLGHELQKEFQESIVQEFGFYIENK